MADGLSCDRAKSVDATTQELGQYLMPRGDAGDARDSDTELVDARLQGFTRRPLFVQRRKHESRTELSCLYRRGDLPRPSAHAADR